MLLMQRTPCPNAIPAGRTVLPWSRIVCAVGFSPLLVSSRLSAARLAAPLATMLAPPVDALLSQPRSGPAGGFEHGQPITPAVPGVQKGTPGVQLKRASSLTASSVVNEFVAPKSIW